MWKRLKLFNVMLLVGCFLTSMLALACPTDHRCCGDLSHSGDAIHQTSHADSHDMAACACEMGEASPSSPLILSSLENVVYFQPVSFQISTYLARQAITVQPHRETVWVRDDSDRHKRLQVFLN